MTDAEIAIERLTDWINRHADHKQRAFIEDVTLVIMIAKESIADRPVLIDLVRRAYTVIHKPHWEQGETDDELASAINHAMTNIRGSKWRNG